MDINEDAFDLYALDSELSFEELPQGNALASVSSAGSVGSASCPVSSVGSVGSASSSG
ncbi:thiocillin family RiPP [Streptomyces sp. NPDC021093]|uniref:thiocillin family RiPP n=1 Tax=Streptomyces sp. NPDC021093 TaxID=3365112 RepID=UPI00379E3106